MYQSALSVLLNIPVAHHHDSQFTRGTLLCMINVPPDMPGILLASKIPGALLAAEFY
jgi:hypothetical protein